MTTITTARYAFRAINADGAVICQARGRAGALTKVLSALSDYRSSVARASGTLYGDPQTLGTYSVDGVERALGPVAYIGDHADEIARLDRLGVQGAAALNAECERDAAAASA